MEIRLSDRLIFKEIISHTFLNNKEHKAQNVIRPLRSRKRKGLFK